MIAPTPKPRFFLDNCVVEAVGLMLDGEGYDAVRLRQELKPNAPDPLVAAYAELNGAVLISDDADFSTLAPRMAVGRRRFQRLSRIALTCKPRLAAQRLEAALSLIELEWRIAQTRRDKRMVVEIGPTAIRTLR